MTKHHALLEPLLGLEGFGSIIDFLKKPDAAPVWASGVVDPAKWHLSAGLLWHLGCPALILTHTEIKARKIYEDLYYFFRDSVCFYPSRDLIFYAADVKSVDITKERLKVLKRLEKCDPPPIVVLSAEALLDRMAPPETFYRYKQSLSVGDVCEPETLIRKLVAMGYTRSSIVEGPGQFAIRGGILDICPVVGEYTNTATHNFQPREMSALPGCPQIPLTDGHALRLEFFGDDIDSIRVIDAHSQRSIENVTGFSIYPMRELVFSKNRLNSAIVKIKEALEKQKAALVASKLRREAAILQDSVSFAVDGWSDVLGTDVDAYLPFFYGEEWNILDYFPKDTILFFDEPNKISAHMGTVWAEFKESVSGRLSAGRLLPKQAELISEWGTVLHKSGSFSRVLYSGIAENFEDFSICKRVGINVRTCPPLRHKPDELRSDISDYLKNGYKLLVMAGSRRHGTHLSEALNEMNVLAGFQENLTEKKLAQNFVTVTRGTLSQGFEYADIKLAVITDKELFAADKNTKRRRRKIKNAEKISHFTDLRIGDHIVHDNHGIGIFKGVEQVTTDGLSRDYLKIEYSDGGHLYVQTSQMDLIHKYIGGERAKLSKLGGADWTRAKAKAKKAVEILASDLLELYAKREAAAKTEYSPDTVWQTEFEAQFPYTETEDQAAAIEDVKRDMQSSKVMDRLICGDVGYGKTEIAIRAAFKAVQDGRQVAYLVPTTILAEQHYKTFAGRMKAYPVTVERLSRFLTKKEQTGVLDRLSKGFADIVIGTHRLLSGDVLFKDLGLIIIDEEQRFGVTHKEKLKRLRANVDVLTLTATPIPRTLHFSLSGIRDMSLLNEPPEERQPIQTYVMEYNQEFVRDAINRELARGGQVYYLHNRVRSITEEAAKVASLVPQARVAFAHGQMSEIELENIMHDFVEGDVDVLVCTTIVETGLDIPNVNTIIISQADFMGLSQLYQLRGRVGRSSRLAYAYLMYRRDKILTEEAEKRLQTIKEFTEFGAGFKIAMRDLEIRGAGNLLGAEQHGHIDIIGYDMYSKLLSEAVAGLRGEETKKDFETTIDISVDAFIPSELVNDEQVKLELYKKISLVTNQQDASDIRDEFFDRFGALPPSVENLLNVALMKAESRKLGVTGIVQKGQNFVLTFLPDANVDVDKLTAVLSENPARYLFTMGANPHLTIRSYKDESKKIDGGKENIRIIRELIGRLTEQEVI